MFWLRNKKNNFLVRTLFWRPAFIILDIMIKLNSHLSYKHLSPIRERSGSVVECLTQDQGAAGLSLTGVTALCPSTRSIYPSLVLVQSRKTRPT